MKKKELIELAHKAGFCSNPFSDILVRHSNGSWVDVSAELKVFAKLVIEYERKQYIKLSGNEIK